MSRSADSRLGLDVDSSPFSGVERRDRRRRATRRHSGGFSPCAIPRHRLVRRALTVPGRLLELF